MINILLIEVYTEIKLFKFIENNYLVFLKKLNIKLCNY